MQFKKDLRAKVLDGSKTETRRLNTKRLLSVGRVYKIHLDWYKFLPYVGLLITARRIEKLGEITKEGAEAEGGYTVPEFQRLWKSINGSWDPDVDVVVYTFKVVDLG